MSKKVLAEISTNVNVGIDEVVAVFVTKYENGLFDRKDEISRLIKAVKADQKALDKKLVEIDVSEYEIKKIPVLNVQSSVSSVDVQWNSADNENDKDSPVVRIRVTIRDLDTKDRYSDHMSKSVYVPISKPDIKLFVSNKAELADLNAQLLEVMTLIKSVSRKERQVRGKISEMKLAESGLKGLLTDNNILSLIQL